MIDSSSAITTRRLRVRPSGCGSVIPLPSLPTSPMADRPLVAVRVATAVAPPPSIALTVKIVRSGSSSDRNRPDSRPQDARQAPFAPRTKTPYTCLDRTQRQAKGATMGRGWIEPIDVVGVLFILII